MEETKREVLDVKDGNISKLNVSRGEVSGRIVCSRTICCRSWISALIRS